MSITLNGTTGLAGANGSASTPAVQGEDANTGIFFPAADTVAVATGGVERLRVDSSGNVGINTTSPLRTLDVAASGSSQIAVRSTSTGEVALRLQNSTTGTGDGDGIYLGRTASVNYLWTYENEPWVLATNNLERMRIDSSGLVTTPYQPHILGSPRNTSGAGIANAFYTRQSTGLSWGGDRITVPVAGRYLVTFMSITEENSSRWDTKLLVNGVVLISALNDLATGFHSRSIVATVALAANDYLQFSNQQWYNASAAGWDEWRSVSVTLLG